MAANIAIATPAEERDLPWQQPFLRDDVKKVLSIQLPEKYILKLKYISNKTNISQQKLARDILCKEIDNLLEELNVRS